jgi:EAL domain-containing protein (putative c-di-GMP-specific phosphodiesterase class I)
MYTAKRERCGVCAYSSAQDPYTADRLALLSELGTAFLRGEMELHYQPRVSLAQQRLRGFEALLRWNHPRLGRLPPGQFIPLAELSDVIRPLTLWVLEQGLRQQREWTRAGRAAHLAVNFSARQLLDDACPEQIEAILGRTGVPPDSLELEITESALIVDPEHATATLERIRRLGVQIAVDDYGTGYSSLSHLRRLPLHALKIDVSFVRNMLRNAQDRVIVESTVGLAHNLGLTVVAEGIEDEGTLAALRAMGCDEGQGYFIAPPMAAADAGRWMASSPLVH